MDHRKPHTLKWETGFPKCKCTCWRSQLHSNMSSKSGPKPDFNVHWMTSSPSSIKALHWQAWEWQGLQMVCIFANLLSVHSIYKSLSIASMIWFNAKAGWNWSVKWRTNIIVTSFIHAIHRKKLTASIHIIPSNCISVVFACFLCCPSPAMRLVCISLAQHLQVFDSSVPRGCVLFCRVSCCLFYSHCILWITLLF